MLVISVSMLTASCGCRDHLVVWLVEDNRGLVRSGSYDFWWSKIEFCMLALFHISAVCWFAAPIVPNQELSQAMSEWSAKLLAVNFAPTCLRLLDYLSMISDVGTVVNLMVEVFVSQEHKAFFAILCVCVVSFGCSINHLRVLNDDSVVASGADGFYKLVTDMWNTELSLMNMAVDLGTTDENDKFNKANQTSGIGTFYIYLFLFIGNMYLVEGFLIGIITSHFNNRSRIEMHALLWKLTRIRRYRYSATPIPAPFNIYWNLHKIHACGVCEGYGLLERWEADHICTQLHTLQKASADSLRKSTSRGKVHARPLDAAKKNNVKKMLLGGAKSGALGALLETLPEEPNGTSAPFPTRPSPKPRDPDPPVPTSGCSDFLLSFWIRLMRFAFVILMSGVTICFGPATAYFCEYIDFHFREDPATTDIDEDDLSEQKDELLLQKFDEIDKNGDGYLTGSEINDVLTSLGLKNVRGSDVVAQMDIDGDGKVSFEVRSTCDQLVKLVPRTPLAFES